MGKGGKPKSRKQSGPIKAVAHYLRSAEGMRKWPGEVELGLQGQGRLRRRRRLRRVLKNLQGVDTFRCRFGGITRKGRLVGWESLWRQLGMQHKRRTRRGETRGQARRALVHHGIAESRTRLIINHTSSERGGSFW